MNGMIARVEYARMGWSVMHRRPSVVVMGGNMLVVTVLGVIERVVGMSIMWVGNIMGGVVMVSLQSSSLLIFRY